MLSEVSQDQKHKHCMFSLMWKIDPKHKHTHKNKHNHVQTHVYNVIVTWNSGTTLWNLGKERKEKRLSVSVIS
jgi:hypothetical protein